MTTINGAVLLAFGIILTAAFSGIRLNKRSVLIFSGLYVFSGILQLVSALVLTQDAVWKLYPVITHLPLILLLCLVYRKPAVAAMAGALWAFLKKNK